MKAIAKRGEPEEGYDILFADDDIMRTCVIREPDGTLIDVPASAASVVTAGQGWEFLTDAEIEAEGEIDRESHEPRVVSDAETDTYDGPAVWTVTGEWGVVVATYADDGRMTFTAERRDDPTLMLDLLSGARAEFNGDWVEAGSYYPDLIEEACNRIAAEYGGVVDQRRADSGLPSDSDGRVVF